MFFSSSDNLSVDPKIALLILYNHRFDRNIPVLENIYGKSFTYIYHIMPFYDGEKENVIPVYESSYCFQGYLAQAYNILKNKGFTHFFVIADDILLNPRLNETSLFSELGITEKDCFIPGFIEFQKLNTYWERTLEAYHYNPVQPGVEITHILPSKETAEQIFRDKNLSIGLLSPTSILPKSPKKIGGFTLPKWSRFLNKQFLKGYLKDKRALLSLKYPLVGSYSDIVLITADVMPKFVQFSGAFAASGLFVEIALPTALVLSASRIVTEKNTLLKGRALWTDEDFKILEPYKNSIECLSKNYPANYMYLHPIKLSKWK